MRRAEKTRALVTGGAGFIGSHIARLLMADGVEVTVLDDLSVGRIENVPGGARFVRGSVLDPDAAAEAVEGVEVVFHNAARVSIRNSFDDVMRDTETNVLGTVNMLRVSGRSGVKRFINASSMAVYSPESAPPLAEKDSTIPASPYGAGKLASETYTRQLARFYGFDHVNLRYFNTYGPGQTFSPYVGVINIFTRNLLSGRPPVIFGTGEQMRDFVYVGDVAEVNIRAMRYAPDGAVLNVGTGVGTSVKKIAQALIETISPGAEADFAEMPRGEPADSVADTTALERYLGYIPSPRLTEKMAEVVDWNRVVIEEEER